MKIRHLIQFLLIGLLLAACNAPDTPAPTPMTESDIAPPLTADPSLLERLAATPEPDTPNASVEIQETLRYTINAQIKLVNHGPGQTDKHLLWLALIRSIPPYQTVEAVQISNSDYRLITDEYKNLYAEFAFGHLPVGQVQTIAVEYQVAVNRLKYDFSECLGPLPNFYLGPELHIEVNNPGITALADELRTTGTACQQARAFYEYIGEALTYTYNGADWGAQSALGPMGADCTEYASLFIALCRNAGIPARYLEGLNYRGIHEDVEGRVEHAWAEAYFPGIGWAAIDPTLGRLPSTRERYFGSFPADHIIVTIGRHPSTLRGKSYFSHLYWGSEHTTIEVLDFRWDIQPVD